VLVTSYTHPEYAESMTATLELVQGNALLLRGTEGEAVADARRTPKMQAFLQGRSVALHPAQAGSLAALPELPQTTDADATAQYIRQVLSGQAPVPEPIAQQVAHVVQLASAL